MLLLRVHGSCRPIWNGAIHDVSFAKQALSHMDADGPRLYKSTKKLTGLITAISEELQDVPLFLALHGLSKTLRCTSMEMQVMRSAILNGGYRISQSHTNPLAIKTDAPQQFVWDVMKCWVQVRDSLLHAL
eukprot:SAG11_NODE_954_length_6397_cov_11.146237_2_plen_131_part_00